MNEQSELPFKFNIGEGREITDWFNRKGIKDAFTMEMFSFRWDLLGQIAYRKGYKKEKTSETIGNFIYALKKSFESFESNKSKTNNAIKCIISKDMEKTIMDIWFKKIKKRPYHNIVIDMAMFNGFVTMKQLEIPITPDSALLWSRYLTGQITISDIKNSISFNPRRIDNEL